MLMNGTVKAGAKITIELGYAEAAAYARHLRLVALVDYEQHAQDADEAHDMLEAGEKIRKELRRAGFAD